ncbi:MAG: glycerate kinase [Betaproteobacteria bacterium]|nr:glycerate kinase [Betaproteobacteria bacterium]
MLFQRFMLRLGIPLALVALGYGAWRSYGWPGVAIVASAAVMWALLHFNRLLAILKRAAKRPVGYVDSAVMLNAKLRRGVSLMHVVALTKALGEPRSPKDVQPEQYRWTDGSDSHVDCEFQGGKLTRWELIRPASDGVTA